MDTIIFAILFVAVIAVIASGFIEYVLLGWLTLLVLAYVNKFFSKKCYIFKKS